MNVKSVVKVMNFHALLRVENSGNLAMKYQTMERELELMMGIIQSNRNLQLDKRVKLPDPSLPMLRIYLGSDLGFCGNVNTSVASVRSKDPNSDQILVGKKIRRGKDSTLFMNREEFESRFPEIRKYLERAVRERCWSAVEIVYNHYYNVSTVKQEIKRIYPMEIPKSDNLAHEWDDFEMECDPDKLLEDMMISCMVYEVRIAAASAYAAENIMRQNATLDSLKKLEESEAEALRQERKEKSQISFRKTIDSFVKQKSLRG